MFMACICFATIGLFMSPCICAIWAFTFLAVSGSFIALAYASWISLSFSGSMLPIMPAKLGGSPAAVTCRVWRREEEAVDRRAAGAEATHLLPRREAEEEEARERWWRDEELGAVAEARAATEAEMVMMDAMMCRLSG